MDTDYALVTVVNSVQDINRLLKAGWKIIIAQFCLHETTRDGAMVRGFYPYTLIGLPKIVAEENPELVGMVATVEQPTVEQPAPQVENPNVDKPLENDQSILGQRRGRQPVQPVPANLFAEPDLNRSEEVMVGIRR